MRLKVIWKRRCEIVHGSLGKEISKRERKAVRKEIRLQYTLGNVGVRAGNKELLEIPKSKVLSSSLRYQRYWVRTLKTSRTYMEDFENNMFSGMRSVIKEWAKIPI